MSSNLSRGLEFVYEMKRPIGGEKIIIEKINNESAIEKNNNIIHTKIISDDIYTLLITEQSKRNGIDIIESAMYFVNKSAKWVQAMLDVNSLSKEEKNKLDLVVDSFTSKKVTKQQAKTYLDVLPENYIGKNFTWDIDTILKTSDVLFSKGYTGGVFYNKLKESPKTANDFSFYEFSRRNVTRRVFFYKSGSMMCNGISCSKYSYYIVVNNQKYAASFIVIGDDEQGFEDNDYFNSFMKTIFRPELLGSIKDIIYPYIGYINENGELCSNRLLTVMFNELNDGDREF